MKIGRWLTLALVIAVSFRLADACSAMTQPIRKVLERTQTILRVEAVSAIPLADKEGGGLVTLKVLEVIKGKFPAPTLKIEGRFADYSPRSGTQFPYIELNCSRAAGCGGCYAYDYKKGSQYLLLMRAGTPYWAPLSPTNEEISGMQDPWELWVKLQLKKMAL